MQTFDVTATPTGKQHAVANRIIEAPSMQEAIAIFKREARVPRRTGPLNYTARPVPGTPQEIQGETI